MGGTSDDQGNVFQMGKSTMKSVNKYQSCFFLILLGFSGVKCTFLEDLVDNFAHGNIHCFTLISEPNAEEKISIDTSNLSKVSVSLYDTNTMLSYLSVSGKNCPYNLLKFNSVETSLRFFNRYLDPLHAESSKATSFCVHIYDNFRSLLHQEKIEDTYYLRRNQSIYIHLLNDDTSLEEVKLLFSSEFYSKVLHAVALTKNMKTQDSLSMWTKSPCDSVGPILTNVWTKSSGFRSVDS